MTTSELEQVLGNCPRMVAVFMVAKKCDGVSIGDVVYWNWKGTFVSHQGDVDIEMSKLSFVGYAPTVLLGDHYWPNLAEMMTREAC